MQKALCRNSIARINTGIIQRDKLFTFFAVNTRHVVLAGRMPSIQLMRKYSMNTSENLEQKFWKALQSDRTMMLGIDGIEDGHVRPMTGQCEGEKGPIWFFTSADNGIVQKLKPGHRAIAGFCSKDHEVFATVHGALVLDTDRAVVERLWNPYVAAWYEGGKDDPTLRLLRLDAENGQVWLNESSLFAGVKMLFGFDPKEAYKDKVAEVDLR